jgi:hypothetical protein
VFCVTCVLPMIKRKISCHGHGHGHSHASYTHIYVYMMNGHKLRRVFHGPGHYIFVKYRLHASYVIHIDEEVYACFA